MLRIFYNSRSAMMAQQDKLDSISNNIANVNTDGYKREDVSFKDLVYETLDRKGYPITNKPAEQKQTINGTGVRTGQWIRDTKQGNLNSTGLNTDFAIVGPGYFSVTTINGGTAYERNGSFDIDASGTLVDKQGNRINLNLTPAGRAQLNNAGGFSKDNFNVNADGVIYLKGKNSTTVPIGKIDIYNAVGDNAFISVGDNLYTSAPGVQTFVQGDTKVKQGYLEGSNVDIAKEMTDMIVTQRAFELGSRGLKTADDMWGLVNSIRGR
ncbi:flagellar hook-basal body complex protein [Clostridium sp. JN-9]|uniref:flagellar hook-basal body complex protein n=1 Tax=Clostridium sp. JN-9 TaxID=2507159 RepID=UPI000FFE0E32|nr:flagellar hook-basal body complex protein [Clostridium sp. JN-9]QAT39971.1 flagellar basal body rod protein FlgG [Clostridium sp. JN-9]